MLAVSPRWAGAVQGRQTCEPKLFYPISLENRVTEDHRPRRVIAIVAFAFGHRLTARFYTHASQPGVDPVVLCKLALLGWRYGVASERRLAAECRLNLAFLWFLGFDLDERPPDRSVRSKAPASSGLLRLGQGADEHPPR